MFLALGVMVGIRGFLNGMQATIRESIIYGQTGALQVHRKGFLKSVNGSPLELDCRRRRRFLLDDPRGPGGQGGLGAHPVRRHGQRQDTSAVAMFWRSIPRETIVCPRRLR